MSENKIKASELRIGNWVSNGEKYFTMDSNTIYDLHNFNVPFEGILLTPEILEKSGFDYVSKYTCRIKGWAFLRSFGGTGLIFHYDHDSNPRNRQVTMKYLHQLQNLYFALTGGELEIKL